MNYYNENNQKAAQWLRALIEQGSIPRGEVDERNIQDVKPAELSGYRQCHFFAGIGGWSLALRLAGISDDEELWTGSCPCQPFSVAGEGMGEHDERHLWPDFRNKIGHCRPPIVFGEQVAKKAGLGWLAGVRADLENASYAVGGADLCAPGVGAPHIRQRLYWMANNTRQRINRSRRMQRSHGGKIIKAGSPIVSVADCEQSGPQRGLFGRSYEERQAIDGYAGCGSAVGGVGDAISAGERRGDEFGLGAQGKQMGEQENRQGASNESSNGCEAAYSFWNQHRTIICKDGKARRIPLEPEFYPLVDGFSSRVAILKGFGNAIVPQLAAEFIQAAFEALTL